MVFGERTLEADPKHYQAMLLLAGVIAQHTKEFDLDREEKLAQVEKYAKTALELLKDAPKPNAGLTDDQWAAAKKDFASAGARRAGMGAMARKKFDVAESEFKTAIAEHATSPIRQPWCGWARPIADDGKYDEAIAQFDKVMAMPDINVQVETGCAGRAGAGDPEEEPAQTSRRRRRPPTRRRPKPEAPKP